MKDKGPNPGHHWALSFSRQKSHQVQALYVTRVRFHQRAVPPGLSSVSGTSEMCKRLFTADIWLCVATYTRLRLCVRLWRRHTGLRLCVRQGFYSSWDPAVCLCCHQSAPAHFIFKALAAVFLRFSGTILPNIIWTDFAMWISCYVKSKTINWVKIYIRSA